MFDFLDGLGDFFSDIGGGVANAIGGGAEVAISGPGELDIAAPAADMSSEAPNLTGTSTLGSPSAGPQAEVSSAPATSQGLLGSVIPRGAPSMSNEATAALGGPQAPVKPQQGQLPPGYSIGPNTPGLTSPTVLRGPQNQLLGQGSKEKLMTMAMARAQPGAQGPQQGQPSPLTPQGTTAPNNVNPPQDLGTQQLTEPQEQVESFPIPIQSFKQTFPKAKPEVYGALANNKGYLEEMGINTPERLRHFTAQMGHESGGFRHLKELGGRSYFKRYEGRKDIGNTSPGDGYKYRGRGIIQLTGKSNYKTYGNKLGIDLVNKPELASNPDIAVKVAARYWKDKGLNKLADKGNMRGITKRINGGYNGLRDRQNIYRKLGQ